MAPHRILVSRQAEADLDAIYDYVARDSAAAARRVVADIAGVFVLLALFPAMGRRHRELSGVRVFPVRRYLIVYDAIDDVGIEVLRVYHTARRRDRII